MAVSGSPPLQHEDNHLATQKSRMLKIDSLLIARFFSLFSTMLIQTFNTRIIIKNFEERKERRGNIFFKLQAPIREALL